jgi:chromosome partitioning protein
LFSNLKGGVAKTTNAVAIAEFLAEAGNRVLVIDADHQCAAGELLLGEDRFLRCEGRGKTLHDLLSAIVKDEFHPDTFNQHVVPVVSDDDANWRSRLSVIPGSIRIDDFQQIYNGARKHYYSNDEFRTAVNRRLNLLRTWLAKNYDYVLIDCPPSLPLQVQMLVKVSGAYIVPSVPDKLSVRGAAYLVDRLRRKNIKLPGLGMLWSLYREANSVHRQMVIMERRRKDIFEGIPDAFKTIVPNATAIVKALESVEHSLNAKYTWPFANMYKSLVKEIEERCKKLPKTKRRQSRRKLASV